MNHKKTQLAVAVEGFKGGGSRTPVEARNTLKSVALANILDLVSEGPIEGLANGLRSIFFDETPIENEDGSYNFKNFAVDYRLGTADQSHIPGFESVENELSVGVELREGAPFVRSFSNTNLDALRIRLSVPALSKTNKSNGDISGYRVNFRIELSTDNGPWTLVENAAFDGKTMSKYERDYKVDLPNATQGWSVRVTRISANMDSAEYQDLTFVESITEIIEAKLRYPYSAVMGVTLEASQFQNIPSRAYEIKGRIIRVPSNYDTTFRTYDGVWDGTFKTAWSDNPAWVYYDLATHPVYGLGHLISDAQVNKWMLYTIGQYCDQLVPDGRGGTEPRFTCNLYLQSRAEAYKVLQDLATVFRGIAFWANGEIMAIQDRPDEPVYTYSPANVIGGEFMYEGTSRKTRYNVALVTWNDMSNMGRASVEYVDFPEGIARYGIQQTDATAIGCTSQAQAQRIGRYLLATSQFETQTVSFQVGLDGTLVAPGKIVLINDPLKAGVRLGGRIAAGSSRSVINVDGEAGLIEIGDTLRVVMSDGTMESRTVTGAVGNAISVNLNYTEAPVAEAMWSVERTNLQAQRYRIVSVTESDNKIYQIVAIRHVEGKFDNADYGVRIDPPRDSQMPAAFQRPVQNLSVQSYGSASAVMATQVVVAVWSAPQDAVSYEIEWRRDNGNWITGGTASECAFEVREAWEGVYQFRVRAVNSAGILSPTVTSEPYTLGALDVVPGMVIDLNDKVDANFDDLLASIQENDQRITDEALTRLNEDARVAQAAADALDAKAAELQAQIDAMDISDILGILPWDATKAYADNDLVVDGGQIYRALQAVPAGTATTNTSYWEPIGNYAELVDEVRAQAAQIAENTTDITNVEGQITAQASDINSLQSRISNAEGNIQGQSSAISALQSTVSSQGQDIQANSQSITSLSGRVTSAETNISANSSALSGLQSTVSTMNGTITSQGNAITQLRNDLTGVDNKAIANAGAITGLTTRVTSAENTLSSQASQITNINAELTNKANVSALNTLTGRVSTAEGKIESQGTALTNLQASIMGPLSSSPNLLTNPTFASGRGSWSTPSAPEADVVDSVVDGPYIAVRATGAGVDRYIFQDVTAAAGQKYWLSADAFRNGAAGGGVISIEYWNSSNQYLGGKSTTLSAEGGKWIRHVVDMIAPSGTVRARAVAAIQSTDNNMSFRRFKLERNEYNTPYSDDRLPVVTANAITSLNANISDINGRITSQATSITNLQASLVEAPNMLLNSTWENNGDWWGMPAGTVYYSDAASGPFSNIPVSSGTGIAAFQNVSTTYIGRRYWFSADVYFAAGDGGVRLEVNAYNAAGNALLSQNSVSANNAIVGKWQRVQVWMDAPVNVGMLNVRIISENKSSTVSIRRAKLEMSDQPTTWTNTREFTALASATSALSAQVTNIDGRVTANANQITNINATLPGKANASVVQTLEAKVNSGLAGSGNLIVNSQFSTGLEGWGLIWNPGGWTFGRNGPTSDWVPSGGNQITFSKAGVAGANTDYGVYGAPQGIQCIPGEKVILSAYTASHRCATRLLINFVDANGNQVSEIGSGWLGSRGNGGKNLAAWDRQFVTATVPVGATRMRPYLWTMGTGESDPYAWFTLPMLERVPADRTAPSPWSAGGSEDFASYSVMTDVNGNIAGLRLKNTGSSSDFSVIADTFRVVDPNGIGSTTFEAGRWVTRSGSYMLAHGRPFGTTGDLMMWLGVGSNPTNASKGNGLFWIDNKGNAYFGGSLSAGTLRNAVQSTSVQTVGTELINGPFTTNGNTRQVTIGFSRTIAATKNALGTSGFVAGAGSNTATVQVYRQIGTAGETLWQTLNVTGGITIMNEGDAADQLTSQWGGSITVNDSSVATSTVRYRAVITAFTSQSFSHSSGSYDAQIVTQNLSIVSVE